MSDQVGDYVPPQGSEAVLKLKKGDYTSPVGEAVPLALKYIYYHAPKGNLVGLNFSGPYTPPRGNLVGLEFSPDEAGGGQEQYVFPSGEEQLELSVPFVRHEYRYLEPDGLNQSDIGDHEAYLYTRYIAARPVYAPNPAFGYTRIINDTLQAFPRGFDASGYGRPVIYNKLQIIPSRGFDAALYGKPTMLGGVKYIETWLFNANVFGSTLVVNTTANQTTKPAAIPAPPLGSPSVSPRMVRPSAILSQVFGSPTIKRPPATKGWQSSGFGYPTIEYKTKQVGVDAFDSLEFFYPAVFDPTQKVLPSSVVRSAVFGDTGIRNTRFIIKVDGILSFESAPWTDLTNKNRYIALNGFDSSQVGIAAAANKTPSIGPYGFDALKPTQPVTNVGYWRRHVEPRGFSYTAVGKPTLTKTPSLYPAGFAGVTGTPSIWFRVRTLEAKGRNQELFGDEGNVWFRYRKYQAEGFYSEVFGQPKLEHEHRHLWLLGANHSAYGRATLTFGTRTLAPKSIFEDFATGHMVGGLRYIQPAGFSATLWGTRIIPERQSLAPIGFSNVYGWPSVRNRTTHILPKGVTTTEQPADSWGTAKLYNMRQHVELTYDSGSDLEPPAWPQWALIENRNKYIGTTGNVMSRYGRAQIDNNATPMVPVGIEAPTWAIGYKAGLVAFRIRTLRLYGVEPPYMSSWARIYNDAFVAAPIGADSQAFGVAALENNRRYFKFQGWNGAAYGYPMVADAIRTLSIESRYSINPPIIPLQGIKLHTRYIDGIGYDTFGQGWHSLSIHWTIISHRWTHREYIGEPSLRNVTPEVGTRGRLSEEFGDTFVRLEWRPVAPAETFTQIIPKPDIAFRDRSVTAAGINSMYIGGGTKVINTGAPPYSPQWVDLSKYNSGGEYETNGHGIGVDITQVPKPSLNQQVVYHRQGSVATLFGTAVVTANSIRVEPGIQQYTMGVAFVSLKNRVVEVAAFSDQEVFEPSNPRLSPHTIYAVKEAPRQAKDNHPVHNLHYVGEVPGSKPPSAVLGRPVVSLYRGIVASWSFDASAVPRPTIFNKRKYVDPKGWHSLRFGWHTIPGTQYSEQIKSSEFALYGKPTVSRPPYVGPVTIKPQGLVATLFGSNRAENLHRELVPKGMDMARMGVSKGGDNPYMWQGLRIGELMPTIPESIDSNVFGESWISHRVRELALDGFDAFICDYDITQFKFRMKVTRSKIPNRTDSLLQSGFESLSTGTPDIKPMVHYIRPDGNSDQYRKGAF